MSAPSGHPVYSSEALVFTNRIQASEEPYDRLHSPQWLTAQGFKRAAEYDVETGWQMVVNQ